MQGNAVIIAGWGYWDVTKYPHGDCFQQAADGTRAVVKQQAIRMTAQETEDQLNRKIPNVGILHCAPLILSRQWERMRGTECTAPI